MYLQNMSDKHKLIHIHKRVYIFAAFHIIQIHINKYDLQILIK